MPLGQAEAAALGLAFLPLAVISHPLAGLRPDDVQARAEAIVAEALYILTTPPAQLAAEYGDRRYSQPTHVFHQAGQLDPTCSDPLSCGI